MDAKTFLVQQHKTGIYNDIRQYSNYNYTNYGSSFWSAIVRLLENYAKIALDIPAEKQICQVCGVDITEFESNLFCAECGKPIKTNTELPCTEKLYINQVEYDKCMSALKNLLNIA